MKDETSHSQAEKDAPPLALYVHWPFCVVKCPYCDFNSHVRDGVDEEAWRQALLDEVRHEAALTPGHRLTSIFFGGGTPSLMDPRTVEAVIDAARQAWGGDDTTEITLSDGSFWAARRAVPGTRSERRWGAFQCRSACRRRARRPTRAGSA